MLKKVIIDITMGIQGPILCKAISSASWGIDATFDRDYNGVPYIDKSHIKGKLKEALKELGTTDVFIEKWLGKRDSDGGLLSISDLYCQETPLPVKFDSKLTRTRMDRKRGVVEETALLYMENAFPMRNTPYEWKGCIEFIEEDNKIKDICTEIIVGLKWITDVGSEKSIGFGKIKNVETEIKIEDMNLPASLPLRNPASEWFTVCIEAEEPLLIGGVQRATNYLESEIVISGGMIKGALAETLNLLCGVDNPRLTPINDQNEKTIKYYPYISKCFSEIRFTHAFPTTGDKRPVVIPYSAVAEGDKFYDVALSENITLINEKAPVFQTDWKKYPDDFGWAYPRAIAKTRTAIDEYSRRAEEAMMFTYQYVCPVDCDNKKIIWRGLIRVPEGDRANLHAELLDVVPRITRIGKRKSKIKVSITPVKCSHAQAENDIITENGLVIVALQSDAIMVNPDDIKNEQTGDKLQELYSKYWDTASGASMKLIRFFAHQKILGGYLVRKHGGKYYPFYLTGAGSVFVLKASGSDQKKAAEKIADWKANGLRLPDWAVNKYKGNEKELWQTFPFVPGNGYGEVMVNLKWHFTNA